MGQRCVDRFQTSVITLLPYFTNEVLLPYFTNEETETKENKSTTQIHSAGVKQNWNSHLWFSHLRLGKVRLTLKQRGD